MSDFPQNTGLGVLIGLLSGNKDTVDAIKNSLGKTIERVKLENDKLCFQFTDGATLTLWDDGQICCEHRYMVTADKLEEFEGATLLDFELKSAPSVANEWGDHEVQFLDVRTSKGVFQMANHNEHNGYYGGFLVRASATV